MLPYVGCGAAITYGVGAEVYIKRRLVMIWITEKCKPRKLLCCMGVGLIVAAAFFLTTDKWYTFSLLHSDGGSSPSISPMAKKVYVITQTYGGQLTRAIRNMMVQQCWAGLYEGVHIYITEPFSSKSQLVHTPQIWSDFGKGQLHTATKFGNYYDMAYYNKQSDLNRFSSLVSWDDFLQDAPRAAIAISIPNHSCSGNIFNEECRYLKPFQSFLDALINFGFNITRTVCLDCSDLKIPYNLDDFGHLILGNNDQISVFVSNWRNFAFTKTWLKIPDYCKIAENPKSNFLIPSSSIVNNSKCYLDKFVKAFRWYHVENRKVPDSGCFWAI